MERAAWNIGVTPNRSNQVIWDTELAGRACPVPTVWTQTVRLAGIAAALRGGL